MPLETVRVLIRRAVHNHLLYGPRQEGGVNPDASPICGVSQIIVQYLRTSVMFPNPKM